MDPRRNSASHSSAPAAVVSGGGLGGMLNTVLVILLIVTSVFATVYLAMRVIGGQNSTQVKGKQYQALFLTNGQVYFGKLKKVDDSYVRLTDIYYLQVQQQVQPGQQNNAEQQPNVSLAKLGSELHGPEDTMYISRDQVLFWENLKDDGKVTQAIKQYQEKK
jgi:hypothetical protein